MTENALTPDGMLSAQNTFDLFAQLWADEKAGGKHAEIIIDELVGELEPRDTDEE